MQTEFFHRDLTRIFPWISPRTLIYWVERGLVQPSIENASGRGSARRYSYSNLIEIAFINELLSIGLPFSKIQRIVKTKEYREIIENHRWDSVFWEYMRVVPARASKDRGAPHEFGVNFSTRKEFKEYWGKYLFGSHFTSSVIIVSFSALEHFVREHIQKIS